MTLLATEFWNGIKTVVSDNNLNPEQREETTGSIGMVLPIALSRSDDCGGYAIFKAGGVNWAFESFCPDAVQADRFYSFDGFAYDWATELHRSPSVVTCEKGATGGCWTTSGGR